ncbi:MAG TPA: ABC transporter permease [Myxococcales bacterium]|nr:ABC transporter permease [Myxococcales bacterium]
MTAPLSTWEATLESAKLYFRNTVFQRRSALILGLVAINIIIAIVWALQLEYEEITSADGLLRITRESIFGFLLPFSALYFGTATIRDEYEGGTLPYLLTRPLSRNLLFLGRLFAAIVTVFAIVLVTQIANILILDSSLSTPGQGKILLALFLASTVYCTVFAALGAAISRPFLVGIIYLILVEFTLMKVPVSIRFATLGAHIKTLGESLQHSIIRSKTITWHHQPVWQSLSASRR